MRKQHINEKKRDTHDAHTNCQQKRDFQQAGEIVIHALAEIFSTPIVPYEALPLTRPEEMERGDVGKKMDD